MHSIWSRADGAARPLPITEVLLANDDVQELRVRNGNRIIRLRCVANDAFTLGAAGWQRFGAVVCFAFD